ncbi:MAG: hypothetical protein IKO85_06865, partial [Bacteroidaceae bacterium]|nr:hypothetical protein [Bacteroidaceae bacterium]
MRTKISLLLTLCWWLTVSLSAQDTPLSAQSPPPAASASSGGHYQQLVRQGFEAMVADSLQRADLLFRQALLEAPEAQANAVIYGQLAAIAERQGKEQEALEDYDIALRLAPQQTSLLLGRASLYLKLGRDDRARADYDAVLTLR